MFKVTLFHLPSSLSAYITAVPKVVYNRGKTVQMCLSICIYSVNLMGLVQERNIIILKRAIRLSS